ncbi:TRM-domain-containing protein [Pleomassaria siparia CBS 279.74]|uniref:tRNA (guanine(26)-N(2))-dimethyltransferase n=1 Tax=Pleomassaria siparia CBS 279.74 TaxID=1314801 RepID=A0A6G1KIH1_9PLEO|nr:TRM-domain-containing protein [Pleomassaria siparia CBS 279.74]
MATLEASEAEALSECQGLTIEAIPKAGQPISHEGREYTTIKEGLAHILVPHDIPTSHDPKMSKEDTQKQQVFYNPIQQFNRDLSVLAIKTFGEDLILRRTQKHEHAQKKGSKKKNKTSQSEIDKPMDNGQSVARPLDEPPSKKRKATDNIEDVSPNDQPLKKTKMHDTVEDAQSVVIEDVSAISEEQNGAAISTGEAPLWRPGFKILDALSATGLRAVRYAQEIPFSTSITANDMSSKAVESIALNIKHNKLEHKIHPSTGNAMAHMYSFVDKRGYDVIDLDPYGTAAPFIDAAIQAINDDGLLCVTCTDSAIFASHGYLEKTYSQYGGLPLIGEACHEGGIRLILHAIASSAGRYGMAIEPLLSLSIDYYARVFVRVRKSPNDVKLLAGKTMIVHHCHNGCGAFSTQYLARNKQIQNKIGNPMFKYSFAAAPSTTEQCEHCGKKAHLSGPMYGGPIHNPGFVERVLAQLSSVDRETYPTWDRMEGMLQTALEEITFGVKSKKPNGTNGVEQLDPLIPKMDPAELDHHPFFFIPSSIAKVLHCQAPPTAAVRGALRRAGFRVTMSHCKPGSIKTDASWKDVWHIMLEWVRQKAPIRKGIEGLKRESAGYGIMSQGSAFTDCEKGAAESEVRRAEPWNGEAEKARTKEADAVNGDAAVVKTEKSKHTRPSYRGIDYEVVFDEHLGRDHDRGKRVRYQLAPRENWGPMARAK